MTIIETIKGVLEFYLIGIGVGVCLRWLAKMIAWGVAEGWSKVPKNINLDLGKITIILKDK